VPWPQDLDGKMKVVELYVVNDNSQVRIPLFCSVSIVTAFVDV